MDRWADADDDIRNGSQKARVVTPGLGGFVKRSVSEPSNSGFGGIEVVPSKKEQKKQNEIKTMPPPPTRGPPAQQSIQPAAPGLPPIPDLPSWVTGPVPTGYFIQVIKDGVVIQELDISKVVTVFGRAQVVDIVLDHQSVSRMHAAIIVQGSTGKLFLMDLGAVHGTFTAGQRLPKAVPKELSVGQDIRFGASTRRYLLQRHAVHKRPLQAIPEEGSNKKSRGGANEQQDELQGKFADLVEAPKVIPSSRTPVASQRPSPAPMAAAAAGAVTSKQRSTLVKLPSEHMPSSLYDALPPAKQKNDANVSS